MLHAMIDLETMGSGVDAAILSIGAIKFDPTDNCELSEPNQNLLKPHEFYVLVDLHSSVRYGLSVDASTIQWWLEQDAEARNALVKEKNPFVQYVQLDDALFLLASWYVRVARPDILWSHATFDATILNHAYRLKDMNPAWGFRDCLDLRTLTRLFQTPTTPYKKTKQHHALWDAWRQANLVKTIYTSNPIVPCG